MRWCGSELLQRRLRLVLQQGDPAQVHLQLQDTLLPPLLPVHRHPRDRRVQLQTQRRRIGADVQHRAEHLFEQRRQDGVLGRAGGCGCSRGRQHRRQTGERGGGGVHGYGAVRGRRLGEGRERLLAGHRGHGRRRQRLRRGDVARAAAAAAAARPGRGGLDGVPVDPGCSGDGEAVVVALVVGVAAVLVGGGAPDGAGDLEDGLLVRGAEGEVGPGDAEAVDAVAVLALEAAELLDELALGEARLEAAAHVLVEGGGVVLVGREGGAALRRELGERAQDHDLVLVGPQPLEQRPPLAGPRAAAGARRSPGGGGGEGGVGVGVGGEVDVVGVAVAVGVGVGEGGGDHGAGAGGGGVVDHGEHGVRSDRRRGWARVESGGLGLGTRRDGWLV
jgi:hypothetical protein